MSEATYQGAICGREGNYGVVFADFPGCVSAADTIAELAEMGREALQLHVDGIVEDGDKLPVPTSRTLVQVAAMFTDPGGSSEENWIDLINISVNIPDRVDTVELRVNANLVQRIADLAESTAKRIDSRRFIEEAVEHEIERYRKSAA